MADVPHSASDAIFAPGLPVEREPEQWWRSVLRTIGTLMRRPGQSFAAVEEPVNHAPVLGFVATLRLPTWFVLVGILLLRWLEQLGVSAAGEAPIVTTVATDALGLQLGEVLAVWLLLMVPLRIPIFYFLTGMAGHITMALTGGAHRSIGASMRALGFAFAPVGLLAGLLEFGLAQRWISPETWAVAVGAAVIVAWLVGATALARTHDARLLRGFLVALVPIVVMSADLALTGFVELPRVPFAPAVDSPYFLPPPPPP